MVTVLKTVVGRLTESSNLSLSAKFVHIGTPEAAKAHWGFFLIFFLLDAIVLMSYSHEQLWYERHHAPVLEDSQLLSC